MNTIDVFNGDADGICALHQLRLATPCESTLVTGVKRDIALLQQVKAGIGDRLTVLDISLDRNRADLLRLLESGAKVTYVDHHYAGEIPAHPALEVMIDPVPEVCTGLLIDRMLQGRFRKWAVVAAFGDNLHQVAMHAAAPLALAPQQLDALRELGEYINYNAYGESLSDLYFHPAELYRKLIPYEDPLIFVVEDPAFLLLKQGYADDMALAQDMEPEWDCPAGSAIVLPDQPWSRRVSGVYGNHLARTEPALAHAVLIHKAQGGFLVSVRAPRINPKGADELCRQFDGGGGRQGAAGINNLPENELERFLSGFARAFQQTGSTR